MKLCVGVTDNDWYRFLSQLPNVGEVNFWQPGGSSQFRALQPGELFLFKLQAGRLQGRVLDLELLKRRPRSTSLSIPFMPSRAKRSPLSKRACKQKQPMAKWPIMQSLTRKCDRPYIGKGRQLEPGFGYLRSKGTSLHYANCQYPFDNEVGHFVEPGDCTKGNQSFFCSVPGSSRTESFESHTRG
ncbi:MAG: hypothetical protein A2038_00150 [Deltaproteobacteria bacterium GWA2_57_13]|nr:MAG: hypothetical protein A2038_00150 [Deltaproteobacteria bacterium GWA2_57_13]